MSAYWYHSSAVIAVVVVWSCANGRTMSGIGRTFFCLLIRHVIRQSNLLAVTTCTTDIIDKVRTTCNDNVKASISRWRMARPNVIDQDIAKMLATPKHRFSTAHSERINVKGCTMTDVHTLTFAAAAAVLLLQSVLRKFLWPNGLKASHWTWSVFVVPVTIAAIILSTVVSCHYLFVSATYSSIPCSLRNTSRGHARYEKVFFLDKFALSVSSGNAGGLAFFCKSRFSVVENGS